MKRAIRGASRLRGAISPPGDKSISHRAAIFGAIAGGESVIESFLPGDDCFSTLRCLEAMGVSFAQERGEDGSLVLRVAGAGKDGLRESADVLDAGNSGTTMRLLSGLLAGQPFFSVLTGDRSLRQRPMGRVLNPLRSMGASVLGRGGDELAPLAIRGGKLSGIDYALPVASAQLKSALVLAALYAAGSSHLTEPGPSRDHTELMLRSMGAAIETDGLHITVHPLAGELTPLRVRVAGDMSSACFWLVAAVCHPNAELHLLGVGMNPTRRGALDVLLEMGADIEVHGERSQGGEPVADLVARTSKLQGVTIQGEMIPKAIDEIPVLALAASLAAGDTIVRDASELRVKESDRIRTTTEQLNRLGAAIVETTDGMLVRGGRRLVGAATESAGDHRLAMTLAVAGLLAVGETTVDGAECVEISYPGFWSDIETASTARCGAGPQ
jgi:3-phosphoshikimate 1-carboxyvinyltransferase